MQANKTTVSQEAPDARTLHSHSPALLHKTPPSAKTKDWKQNRKPKRAPFGSADMQGGVS